MPVIARLSSCMYKCCMSEARVYLLYMSKHLPAPAGFLTQDQWFLRYKHGVEGPVNYPLPPDMPVADNDLLLVHVGDIGVIAGGIVGSVDDTCNSLQVWLSDRYVFKASNIQPQTPEVMLDWLTYVPLQESPADILCRLEIEEHVKEKPWNCPTSLPL